MCLAFGSEQLVAAIQADPTARLTLDLVQKQVKVGSHVFPVTMPESAREALVTGQWDYLGRLLGAADQVGLHAAKIPYLNAFQNV